MRSFIVRSAIAIATVLSLGFSAQAACVDNGKPIGTSQVLSYDADGSRNVSIWYYDPDISNVGGIARYNTSGQVLQTTTVPYMNFTVKTGQYVVFKNVNSCGGFVSWVRGFNY